MPIKPTVSTLNANTVGILNTIRANASADYIDAVPVAEATTESIRAVGNAILSYQPRMNEFVSALVNRIGLVMVTSKLYSNPLKFMKKGVLQYGESIEEIFVDLAKANAYDWNTTTDEAKLAFQRKNPDIKTAFHALNLQTYYQVTVSKQNLEQAFLSVNGVTDLVTRIVNSLYSAANYDEFIMIKYTIAQNLLAGNIAMRTIDEPTDETTGKKAVKAVKSVSNKFGFMSKEFNIAGVSNYVADNADKFVVMTSDFETNIGVDVLAAAFNIDKVEFEGKRVLVDSFAFNSGELDRLDMLLSNDPGYTRLSDEDNDALKTVGAVLMGRDYPQVYDVRNEFTEEFNGALLYYNEFYHVWRVYSASPFTPVCGFTTGELTVTNVAVSAPSTAKKNERVQAVATVTASPFVNQGVTFSISPTQNVTLNPETGIIVFGASASGAFTVTATSTFDSTKKGTAQITVS